MVFGKVSSGAQNDLERVTKQAYAMVSIFGMSEKVGTVSYYDSPAKAIMLLRSLTVKKQPSLSIQNPNLLLTSNTRGRLQLCGRIQRGTKNSPNYCLKEKLFSLKIWNISSGNAHGKNHIWKTTTKNPKIFHQKPKMQQHNHPDQDKAREIILERLKKAATGRHVPGK
jgi:AFG3 family protein